MNKLLLLLLLSPLSCMGQSVISGNSTITGNSSIVVGGSAPTVSLRGSSTIDSGTVANTGALALPIAANAGDLIFIGVVTGGNTSISSVCDKVGSSACSSSASTYTRVALAQCQGGSGPCTSASYTCNASAGVDHVTVVLTGADDENVIIAVVAHTVTTGCLDAHPTPVNSASAGASITSNTYNTAVANEIALFIFADDSNNGPAWNGTAGTGFTLISRAAAANSMLGVGEYKIYTTTQTGTTASLNTGNSSGHAVATDLFTFE